MSTAAETLSNAIFRSGPIPEVTIDWLAENRSDFRVIDCREADELVGPLGALDGIEHVPLHTIPAHAPSWEREQPVVIICRSGGRSGQAAMFLERAGFSNVASVAGGMLAWRERFGA